LENLRPAENEEALCPLPRSAARYVCLCYTVLYNALVS